MPLGPAEGCQDAVAAAASTRLLCEGRRSSTSDTGVAEDISPTSREIQPLAGTPAHSPLHSILRQ